jgi:hypothetical protein
MVGYGVVGVVDTVEVVGVGVVVVVVVVELVEVVGIVGVVEDSPGVMHEKTNAIEKNVGVNTRSIPVELRTPKERMIRILFPTCN